MTKPFDSTLKDLLNVFAVDWADWLGPRIGLSAKIEVEPLDVDLSTVQRSADKVFRLKAPAEGLLHIEPQASRDVGFPGRMLQYNLLLDERYGGPVYSVALLLRRDAAPGVTGLFIRKLKDNTEYIRYQYFIIKVWELQIEPLMACGIGALPLVLLTDEAAGQLGTLVDRIDARLSAENVPNADRVFLLTCGYILLGLRYDGEEIRNAYTRVRGMKESSTYREILEEGEIIGLEKGREEGREEGELKTRQTTLLDILRDRFGDVPGEVESRIRAVTEAPRLQHAILRAIRISSIDNLEL